MSGLLPRTNDEQASGLPQNITCHTLTASNYVQTAALLATTANISTLTAGSITTSGALTIGSLALSSDPAVDTGVTALMYDGVNTAIGKKVVVDLSSAQTLGNKTVNTDSTTFADTGGTRQLIISLAASTASTVTALATSSTTSRTLVLPDVTGTLVARNSTDTLTNKTLTAPIISTITNTGTITVPTTTGTLALVSQLPTNANYVDLTTAQTIAGVKTFSSGPAFSTISNSGILTLPTGAQTIVARNTVDVLSNKSLIDSTCAIVDNTDNTKQLLFDVAGTTATSTTLLTSQTVSRILTLPNVTDTLVARTDTATLTNKTIDSSSNPISIAGTNIGSIISASNPLLTTSTPQFARIGLGVASDQAMVLTSDTLANDKIVMFRGGVVNSNQFFGFGLSPGVQRYHVAATTSDHAFFAGTGTSTSNELFRVKGVGGCTFPTTGGTASTLSYFETGSVVFTFSGPPASGATITASFQRIGNVVTLYLPAVSVTATSSTFFTSGITLFTRLAPVANVSLPIFVIDMSTSLPATGQLDVLTTGVINIYKVAPTGAFTGTLTCGWKATTLSWLIA